MYVCAVQMPWTVVLPCRAVHVKSVLTDIVCVLWDMSATFADARPPCLFALT